MQRYTIRNTYKVAIAPGHQACSACRCHHTQRSSEQKPVQQTGSGVRRRELLCASSDVRRRVRHQT
eukprot:1136797-Pelagomonas_calceolata.AAC.7